MRETIRNGEALWHGPLNGHGEHTLCGYDVAVVEGGRCYVETFPIRDQYRSLPIGGYAVVDNLYACGCRS